MFEACEPLVAEMADVEAQLADPGVHSDPPRSRRLGRRYAELRQIVETYRAWSAAEADATAADELAAEDESFAGEARTAHQQAAEFAEKLTVLLAPRDPLDSKDVILEIKAGEGGAESALFAGDLLRMYLRYAERRGWATEVLDREESDLGGIKDVVPGGEEPRARCSRTRRRTHG